MNTRRVTPALLALNQADASVLSPLDMGAFDQLVARSFVCLTLGDADAMLIAFDQDADYASRNFQWCRERFDRFVYIDRVVIAATHRRRGLGSQLYQALFERAQNANHTQVLCEISTLPPNPGSASFHAALGFETVGSDTRSDVKRVEYLRRPLISPDG